MQNIIKGIKTFLLDIYIIILDICRFLLCKGDEWKREKEKITIFDFSTLVAIKFSTAIIIRKLCIYFILGFPILFDQLQHVKFWDRFYSSVVYAPVVEEIWFRLPLICIFVFCIALNKKTIAMISFYIINVLFGLIHIFNYIHSVDDLLFGLILTSSHIAGGLILGYVAIRYGLRYSIFLHAYYNFLCILL